MLKMHRVPIGPKCTESQKTNHYQMTIINDRILRLVLGNWCLFVFWDSVHFLKELKNDRRLTGGHRRMERAINFLRSRAIEAHIHRGTQENLKEIPSRNV
jgi:hypothetical protein